MGITLYQKWMVKRSRILKTSVGFRSWSRSSAVSLQVTEAINPAVGCRYFSPGPRLPPQPPIIIVHWQKLLEGNKEQWKIETKASSHQGQCIPAGSSVSPLRLVLLSMSIITMRSKLFPANSASDCLRFAKFRPQFCESCGATYTRICEMFSALQSRPTSRNRCRK